MTLGNDSSEPSIRVLHQSLTEMLEAAIEDQSHLVIEILRSPDNIDTAIHSARKTLKRLRSLLRLDRERYAPAVFRSMDRAYGDAGRVVADVRDGFVLIATHEEVAPSNGSTSQINSILRFRYDQLRDELARTSALEELVDRVAEAHAQVGHHAGIPHAADTGKQSPIGIGLRKTFRTGRRRYAIVQTGDEARALHSWRKPVKYLRHQLEFLAEAGIEPTEPMVTHLSDLGDILGYHHDLQLLSNTAHAIDPSADALFEAIHHAQVEQRTRALALGDHLFVEKPEAFMSRYDLLRA